MSVQVWTRDRLDTIEQMILNGESRSDIANKFKIKRNYLSNVLKVYMPQYLHKRSGKHVKEIPLGSFHIKGKPRDMFSERAFRSSKTYKELSSIV